MPSKTPPAEVESPPTVEDIDLSGAPILRPVGTFRTKQRSVLLKQVRRIGALFEEDEVDVSEMEPAAVKALEAEREDQMLTALGEIDELLESVAVDGAAYAHWSTIDGGGPDADNRVIALFSRFADDLGKSMGSAS